MQGLKFQSGRSMFGADGGSKSVPFHNLTFSEWPSVFGDAKWPPLYLTVSPITATSSRPAMKAGASKTASDKPSKAPYGDAAALRNCSAHRSPGAPSTTLHIGSILDADTESTFNAD